MVSSHDLSDQFWSPLREMTGPGNFSRNNSIVLRAVWQVASSCANQMSFRSISSNWGQQKLRYHIAITYGIHWEMFSLTDGIKILSYSAQFFSHNSLHIVRAQMSQFAFCKKQLMYLIYLPHLRGIRQLYYFFATSFKYLLTVIKNKLPLRARARSRYDSIFAQFTMHRYF